MKKCAVCIAIGLLVVGVYAWQGFYDDGSLIDATGAIIYEEDDDIEELGRRLVALAAGEEFTEEQIEQISELVAGLFWAVSFNSWEIEELDHEVRNLEKDLEDIEDELEELQIYVEDLENHLEERDRF